MSNGKLPERAAASLSTAELIKEITSHVGILVKKQIELAKTELRADLRAEAVTLRNLGLAALGALVTVNLLLVTAVLALGRVMPGWAAGLLVSAFTALLAGIAAALGWGGRLRKPMARTRHTLDEDVRWTKERLA